MDITNIYRIVSKDYKLIDSGATYLGTYSKTPRSSLLTSQIANRASKGWGKGEIVVAYCDDRNSLTPLDQYLSQWKLLAYPKDQMLLLEVNPGDWKLYDYAGNLLCSNDEIEPYIDSVEKAKIVTTAKKSVYVNNDEPLQQIFYGAPGTGKSHTIKETTKALGIEPIRTTFHPDTDYSSFVGAYKPTTIEVTMRDDRGLPVREKNPETGQLEELKDNKIVYDFVPQAFLQAYIEAWRLMAQASTLSEVKPQFLIIEEINRGNCAQIFGDLFQLLDRGDSGFSDYPIKADADMKKQLAKAFKGLEIPVQSEIDAIFDGRSVTKQVLEGDVLLLPSNLYIWATMNTSDQSLFPIDSAFKRRWDWRYRPILDAGLGWTIAVDNLRYDWNDFLTKINDKVFDTTGSEDKKLGYFFAKAKDGKISAEKFVAKVIFYLWNDVFKDYGFEDEIFQDEDGSELSFTKFYPADDIIDTGKVISFLDNLGVDYYEADDEETENISVDKPKQNRTRYLINGQPRANGKPCPPSYILINIVSKYVADHKEDSASDVLVHWKNFGGVIAENIISDAEHTAYLTNGTTPKKNDYFTAVQCADSPVWVRWQGWSEIVDGEPKLNILISDLADKHTGYEITVANQ